MSHRKNPLHTLVSGGRPQVTGTGRAHAGGETTMQPNPESGEITRTQTHFACANPGHGGREPGGRSRPPQELFWFNENAGCWPSGFYCRKCLRDVLQVNPDGRTSLSEEAAREAGLRELIDEELRAAGLI